MKTAVPAGHSLIDCPEKRGHGNEYPKLAAVALRPSPRHYRMYLSMPPPPPGEVLRQFQDDARRVAEILHPKKSLRSVRFVSDHDSVFAEIPIPADQSAVETVPELPSVAGWSVTERGAFYCGNPVPIAPSRLRLLRTLLD